MNELRGPYLEIPKGDTRDFTLQLLDEDDEPYDLSGVVEITFKVVESDTEGAAQVFSCTKTSADITIVGDATDGTIKIAVVAADTSSATAGKKIWQVKVEPSSGVYHRSYKGIFNIMVSHA